MVGALMAGNRCRAGLVRPAYRWRKLPLLLMVCRSPLQCSAAECCTAHPQGANQLPRPLPTPATPAAGVALTCQLSQVSLACC